MSPQITFSLSSLFLVFILRFSSLKTNFYLQWAAQEVTLSLSVLWVRMSPYLLKHQLNHNSTQPNITLVGLDMKMTLHPTTTIHRNSMLAISQLLLTWFWWNFNCGFLATSKTDHNFHGDICSGNIHPGDICPYQEYLSCYWPDFN